jgi:hypothetical protein
MGITMRTVAVLLGIALVLAHGLYAIPPLIAFLGFWLWQMRAGRLSAGHASG